MKTPIFILRNAWNMEVKIKKNCTGSFTFVQDDTSANGLLPTVY